MSLELLVFILCALGFRVVYECIRYKYGARIKAMIEDHKDEKKALKVWDKNQMDIKLKFAKSQEVQEVEAEEIEYNPSRFEWEVYNEYENYKTKLIE